MGEGILLTSFLYDGVIDSQTQRLFEDGLGFSPLGDIVPEA